ncbi:MAG: hypothetical protein WA766_11760 [Candidatus Acidiferrales bacterium]
MSSSPSLYRYLDFIGGNILDASNVALLQSIVSTQPSALQAIGATSLSQVYQQGTLLNAVFAITGTGLSTAVVLNYANSSYAILTLVNGQFESLGSSYSVSGTAPTVGTAVPLYLNWSLNIITSAQDPTFVDGITGEPTIEAGQIDISVSWTDTSGVSLDPSTQFAKNTSPIILGTFDTTHAITAIATYINGVYPYAEGNPTQAGLVSLTDTSGIAVGTTDSRNSDARDPIPGSVYNSSVAALISSGTNSSTLPAWMAATDYSVGSQIVDSNGNIETVVSVAGAGMSGGSAPSWSLSIGGDTVDNPGGDQITWQNAGPASTTKYDPATPSQGGIFTDSIIYTTLKESLTTFLDLIGNTINGILSALQAHVGQPLGSSETHPFPTAAQVGAAPASHVGLPLGLPTSHPALVNSDTGGFSVDEITTTVSGEAYGLYSSSSVKKAAMEHSGDFYSIASGAYTATAKTGDGVTSDPNNGTLTTLSRVAAILSDHVGYNVTGQSPVANNPHNLQPGDIGAASQAYVDATVAAILAAAQGYTTARTNITVRKVTNTLAANTYYATQIKISAPEQITGTPPVWTPNSGGIQLPAASTMTYLVFTFGSTSGLSTLPMWQPSNYYNLGFQIIDTGGFIQKITAVGVDGYGISGGSVPSFSNTTGHTTADGSGDTNIVWTCEGPASTLAGFEIAIGSGVVAYQGGPLSSQPTGAGGTPHGDAVPIPEVTPANNPSIPWTYSKALATVSGSTTWQHTDQDEIEAIQVTVDPSTFQVYGFSRTGTHTPIDAGWASVNAIFYRQL